MSLQPESFTVGWICAIDTEFVVACELLDEEYTQSRRPRLHKHDHNSYHFGRIHEHNVVIACLPKGRYGNISATLVAMHMVLSFSAIRIGLMVGIGAGAPSSKHDIRLGDVVVSSPTPRHGGVVQYDYGKAVQDQEFEEIGYLAQPPQVLLTALSYLSTQHKRKGHQINETISNMLTNNKRIISDYSRPGPECDKFFDSSFVHTALCPCQGSDRTSSIKRTPRGIDKDDPAVHYGLVASANTLLKNALLRDQLSEKHDILCFEMEAAGLMDNFPCVVIRGICDYADTHKNDQWQGYAAATAAAYAKELLGVIPGTEIKATSPVAGDKVLWNQSTTTSDFPTMEDDQETLIQSPVQSLLPTTIRQIIGEKYDNSPGDRPIKKTSSNLGIEATGNQSTAMLQLDGLLLQRRMALRELSTHGTIGAQPNLKLKETHTPNQFDRSNTTYVKQRDHQEANAVQLSKVQLYTEPSLVSVEAFLSGEQPGLLKLDTGYMHISQMLTNCDAFIQRKHYRDATKTIELAMALTGQYDLQSRLSSILLQRKLGDIRFETGDLEGAAKIYQEIWSEFPNRDRSIDALEVAERLALAHARLNWYKPAVDLLQHVLKIRRKYLGICHPSIAVIIESLVVWLDKQQRYSEAALLYRWLWLAFYLDTERIDGHHFVRDALGYYLQKAGLTLEQETLHINPKTYFKYWVASLVLQSDVPLADVRLAPGSRA